MPKKSQVTVFIIIVLIILMMVGVTYYMISSRVATEGEERVLRQQVSAARIDPVDEYITSCLSLASSEGLELLGKQGGYIYTSQGGIVPDPLPSELGTEYADYNEYKVHYGIYAPVSNVGTIFFAKVPKYPWPTFPELYHPSTGEIVDAEYFEGYYGRNKLPPFDRPKPNSIQEQLEEFTVSGVLSCIDWTTFTQQGLNISAGDANVSVVFADRDVTFRLEWPIAVTDLGTGAVTDLFEFIAAYPVRLRRIYDFAAVIMDEDVGNISYDIKATDGIISASTVQNIFGNDDLIIIRDADSRILDQQYEFSFARKNRPPALYYIHNRTGRVCNSSVIQSVPPNKLNIVDACAENSYELNFTAIDPDEEKLNFSYNVLLPHEITSAEAIFGTYKIRVEVSDGELADSQEIYIPTRRS